MNLKNNKNLVTNFIDTIWNKRQFSELGDFIHPAFIDYSLPPALPANVEGLKIWISGTGTSFEHKTLIEEHVSEGNKSIIKIRMLLKHISTWRSIEATGAEITAVGYRCFRIEEGKIIEHWALLDGNSIENQLKASAEGCKIQE